MHGADFINCNDKVDVDNGVFESDKHGEVLNVLLLFMPPIH